MSSRGVSQVIDSGRVAIARAGGCMARRVLRTVFVSLLPLLVACASTGRETRDALQPARVYFARTLSTTAAFQTMAVTVGWKRLALLERGDFVEMDFPPGTHEVRVYCSGECVLRTIKIIVEAHSGASSYFVIDPDFRVEKSRYVYISRVLEVDQDAFGALLPQLKPIKPLRAL